MLLTVPVPVHSLQLLIRVAMKTDETICLQADLLLQSPIDMRDCDQPLGWLHVIVIHAYTPGEIQRLSSERAGPEGI
jgi:hypothetical protein